MKTAKSVQVVDPIEFEALFNKAHFAAIDAANRMGEHGCCGFAWVSFFGVRKNSKLGKKMIELGMRQGYDKSMQWWNPAGVNTQSIDMKEAGADAAAAVFRDAGMTAYSGSRMD